MYNSPHITVSQVKRFLMAILFVSLAAILPFQAAIASSPHAKPSIRIGEKNFPENEIIAAMFQVLLQHHGFSASIHQLGETPELQAALLRGGSSGIDMYPEYTGTGLQQIGNRSVITDPVKVYDIVKPAYKRKFHVTWLLQAPMNDTNGVAVTKATARKYHLTNLSSLARVANKLSFAMDPACPPRPDCLAGMQKKYGIRFASTHAVSSGPVRYQGLMHGQYNVVEVFTTDPQIGADHLVVLPDNKNAVFPADHVAPIVRDATLHKYPRIKTILNPLAKHITTSVMINLNGKVGLQGKSAISVARNFLKSIHMI